MPKALSVHWRRILKAENCSAAAGFRRALIALVARRQYRQVGESARCARRRTKCIADKGEPAVLRSRLTNVRFSESDSASTHPRKARGKGTGNPAYRTKDWATPNSWAICSLPEAI